ncbi:hypothetical protein FYJ34_04555 [Clostridiaceae bacterium 68-1-5]|uniref:Uncharacterized protein n=1 Tax=Suipraeoptans intestinalis TaxID=2606628 RepID=A0A6N7UZ22_9FIRM|nr:hypothetical protein [Suipraeoptans intestinalis]
MRKSGKSRRSPTTAPTLSFNLFPCFFFLFLFSVSFFCFFFYFFFLFLFSVSFFRFFSLIFFF